MNEKDILLYECYVTITAPESKACTTMKHSKYHFSTMACKNANDRYHALLSVNVTLLLYKATIV